MRNPNINQAFLTTLSPYFKNNDIKELVLHALGCSFEEIANSEEWPISGFYLQVTDQVFSLYLTTPGRFILAELSTQGDILTVMLPIERITRVVSQLSNGTYTLTIEIDADGSVVRNFKEESGEIYTRSFPSAYIINASGSTIPALGNFATGLRSLLAL